jgi:hypothetical protein
MPEQKGACPVCSKRYFLAERLFETYGSELFTQDAPEPASDPDPEGTRAGRRRTAVRILCFLGAFLALGISYSFAQHKPAGETITILVMMFVAAWATEFLTR